MHILVHVHLITQLYSLLSQSLLITTVAYHVLFIIRIPTLIIGVAVVGYKFGRGGDFEFDRLLSLGFSIALICYLSLEIHAHADYDPKRGVWGSPPR